MPRLVYVDRVIELEGELVLGRHSASGLRVDDDKASRRHARVFQAESQWWVEDLESANGTLLNGKPIRGRVRIGDDDCIAIGQSRILFQDGANAAAAAAGVGLERRSATAVGVVGNPSLLVGRTIAGFRLDAVLGKSPLGAVYRAHQLAMARDVAFRAFKPEVADQAGFAERLLTSARRAGTLRHPGVVQIHECGQDDEIGLLWYAMELVEGETLASLVARDGRMQPAQALLLIERAAMALQAAHAEGQLHQDLSPANIMLSTSGQVRILELGLSDVLALGRGAGRLGDPAYRCPELAAGAAPDPRADIYALGCTLWFLLAGEPPFRGDDLAAAHRDQPVPSARTLDPRLPAKLDDLLQGMLNKNPEWRFATLTDVLTELKPLRESLPISAAAAVAKAAPAAAAGASGTTDRFPIQSRRPRAADRYATLITAGWVVGIVVVGWWLWDQPFVRRARGLDVDAVAPSGNPVAVVAPVVTRPAPPTPATGGRVVAAPVAGVRPPSGPLAERWRQVQVSAEQDAREGSWGSAERHLREFLATPGLDSEFASAVRLVQGRLQVDGEAWYQAELAKLPDLSAPGGLPIALKQLGRLRDVVIAVDRGDAEARYHEAQTRLLQRLEAVRRQARQRLEAGKAAELPPLAAALAADFSDTPIAGVQRQFSTLLGEAARSARLWQGSWPVTRAALSKATGEPALAAAAALLLSGDIAAGKQLLANEPALREGALLRRREALLGREAAVLRFTDATDLQFIETTLGELQFGDGGLTGTPGEACGLACTVPVGGPDWDASLVLDVADAPGASAQVNISCVADQHPELVVSLVGNLMTLRAHAADGWHEQQTERPPTTPLHLRLVCRGGKLQIVINDAALMEVDAARIPAGARLGIDLVGATWKLDELQVVGGG